MPSLGQLYNDKESGLTTRKTYNVPIASIYAEEGYNAVSYTHLTLPTIYSV